MENTQQSIERIDVFRLGSWLVEPASGSLSRNDEVIHLAPKVMELLLFLVRNQGEVVSKEQLMSAVWPDTFVAETALTRSISELRHSLDDNSSHPVYIETIPKRGYRLLAKAEEYQETKKRSWVVPVSIGATLVVLGILLLVLIGNLWDRKTVSEPLQSLVVLPFDSVGTTPESDVLTLGFVEIIIESLARIDSLEVASGTSLTHFEHNSKDLKGIASRMGFSKLLEGSFKINSNSITVSIHLSDTRANEIMWSEDFALNNENIGEVANEITQGVASALNLEVKPSVALETEERSSESFEALQYRLMADHFRNKLPDSLDKAVEYYQKSIQEKPSYAPAYAGLAIAYMGLGEWGEDKSWAPKAQEAVSKALALDKNDPESHIANGIFLRVYRKDFLASELAFKEAIRLNPYHSNARREYGLLLMRDLGRPDEALFQLSEATRLDPLLERNYVHLFELYCIRSEYEKAMSTARRQFELNRVNPHANRNIALAYWLLGDSNEAIIWAEKSVELYEFSIRDLYFGRSYQLLTALYLSDGNFDQAEETVKRLDALDPGSSTSLAEKGLLALYRQEYEAAASCFRRAIELHPDDIIWPTGIRLTTYLAFTLQQIGDRAGAERALIQSDQLSTESNSLAYERNIWPPLIFQDELAVYVLRGDEANAVKYLDGLIEHGWKACILVESNPLFIEALKNPDLRNLCESVKPELEAMRLQLEMEGLSLR